MSIRLVQQFLKLESSSGIILLLMAVISMSWVNSPLAYLHQVFTGHFLFLINDGLMAFFFLLVGLELKRDFLEGPLSHLSKVALPAAAALGGMLVPALIYSWVNWNSPETLRGWATPVATDIAFAVGVLSLFGRRIPASLKFFLLALAIFDDIGAILIIAFCYSHGLSVIWFGTAGLVLAALYLLNRFSVQYVTLYLVSGALLWLAILQAGIHPTIAGVLLALMVPLDHRQAHSPLHRLERNLHPWVAYLIMPLFALANAGFVLHGRQMSDLTNVVVLGIVLGLFVGKQIGVFGMVWLMVKCRWAKLPHDTSWMALYGIALLCGIGFTMSLFLGTLAFNQAFYLSAVRMGVMLGSILSGLAGAVMLQIALKKCRSSTGE